MILELQIYMTCYVQEVCQLWFINNLFNNAPDRYEKILEPPNFRRAMSNYDYNLLATKQGTQ